jgi:hypothetical protein
LRGRKHFRARVFRASCNVKAEQPRLRRREWVWLTRARGPCALVRSAQQFHGRRARKDHGSSTRLSPLLNASLVSAFRKRRSQAPHPERRITRGRFNDLEATIYCTLAALLVLSRVCEPPRSTRGASLSPVTLGSSGTRDFWRCRGATTTSFTVGNSLCA